jgi:hypothetical protein
MDGPEFEARQVKRAYVLSKRPDGLWGSPSTLFVGTGILSPDKGAEA